MNYDDPIFKVPSIPSKRKAAPDPSTLLKSSKPRLEDPSEKDGLDTGPSLEDLEAEEFEEDEEGGRFHGSGMSTQQREILSYLDREDNAGDGEVIGREGFGERDVKKLAAQLEKAITVNENRRAKFDDPAKYIDSEADLFTAVASWTFLSEHSDLYPVFVQSGALEGLMKLFAHENIDIAISVLEVLLELTAEDVELQKESDMQVLIEGMFKNDGIEVMVGNLERLDESKEDDRRGVFHTLTVLENITSFNPSYASRLPLTLTKWLLPRISQKERPISQNKQYAAEILSIILQLSRPQLHTTLSLKENILDILLTQLSPYRKRDPAKNNDDEEEFVENVFDALCTCVQVPRGKSMFLELEGVELCLLFLRGEGKVARSRGLKVLDFAVGGVGGDTIAEKLIDAGGLKILFGMFMKKPDNETAEHLIGIFVNLFRHLPADSPPRLRLLVKFVEKDYAKISTLLSIRDEFITKLARIDVELSSEPVDPDETPEQRRQRWYLRKVEGGGFVLQLCAILMAWLAVEDKGMKEFLHEKVGLEEIRETIKEQLNSVEEPEGEEDGEDAMVERDNAKEEKEIMEVLIDLLGSDTEKENEKEEH